MKITLNILAEDIPNYLNPAKCAITKALQRVGINARDTGAAIVQNESDKRLTSLFNKDYKYLSDKVVQMFHNSIPVEDFSFEIELDL